VREAYRQHDGKLPGNLQREILRAENAQTLTNAAHDTYKTIQLWQQLGLAAQMIDGVW